MNKGFYISKLEVRGSGKTTAELKFEPGFNLVSGGSDTGKSFVFSCLEFMLGKDTIPKSIPESTGYTEIYLQINTFSGKKYTLNRKIIGGDYLMKESSIEDFKDSTIKIKQLTTHVNSKDSISDFLLDKCDFEIPVPLKKNQKNETKKLTFNTLRNLTFVDEVTILNETSPFYNKASYIDYTYYKYLVNYLLSGSTAENLTKIPDDQLRKSWTGGKIDFVKSQINHISDKLVELEKQEDSFSSSIPNVTIDEIKTKLTTTNKLLKEFSEEKEKYFHELQEKKSNLIYKKELEERLVLLKKHYLSDQQRLSFIEEGESLLSQLNTVDCPLCNSELNIDQQNKIKDNIKIKDSIEVEAQKISIKLADLESTVDDLKAEIDTVAGAIGSIELKIEEKNKVIEEVLNPNLDSLNASISNYDSLNKIRTNIEIYRDELQYYHQEKEGLENDMKLKPNTENTNIGFGSILKLMPLIKSILESWNYQESIDVQFDNTHKTFDIVISGKPRSSYGKGMRSISYTAVINSILKFCTSNGRPFSNLLVFDSPLTTYHGGDAERIEDKLSENIQNAFFKSMALTGKDRQIIIFDNKFPEEKIANKINFEYFTKSKTHGRYGFFPIN